MEKEIKQTSQSKQVVTKECKHPTPLFVTPFDVLNKRTWNLFKKKKCVVEKTEEESYWDNVHKVQEMLNNE